MFQPKYHISHRLARALRQIGEAMGVIKSAGLGEPGLQRLVLDARSLSAHASTSIEGNPLPLQAGLPQASGFDHPHGFANLT